mgnify:FL=1|jgi:phage-related baseplate assembly protein|tara:strand:- start:3204 stop:5048 length:1845 start_codon:yes stop_codon:yes gene_type:complete
MAVTRNINYINKDFTSYRNQLVNYSQTYFPTTYTDFSPTSPGMMFIEQAAYVGDVLSFYLDNQIQENYLQYARQTNNLYDMAYMYGYKPRVTGLATVTVDLYQQVPAKLINGVAEPDYDYAVIINANTQITTTSGTPQTFIIEDSVNFTVSSSSNPTSVTVAQITSGVPDYYLLRKSTTAYSGTIKSTDFSFGAPVEFATVSINAPNIANIIDVIDSDGNQYYEVDYLGQDLVFDGIRNTNVNDPNTYNDSDTPYLLQTKSVQNRFATRYLASNLLQLQFGAGSPATVTENVIPNPFNVGLGLPFGQDKLTTAYSPTNFIFTNTYGNTPSNTTLTVRYLSGGGVGSNILANSLTNVNNSTIQFLKGGLNVTTAQYVFDSIASNNPYAANGGNNGDTIEDIRQNAISQFSTQMRNVTQDDYLVRALSMPSKFGTISKAFTQKPNADEANTTLDIYCLSQNEQSQLTIPSSTLKNNLKTYLNEYRMIGDTISIKNAFIINFAIDFEIITYPNYINNKVLSDCIVALRNYFKIDKWQINQPIITPDLFVLLDAIDGVQTVKQINFTNKTGTSQNYSEWAYDMNGANQNGTIFPSLDPSIFELKFPNSDIKGRVVNLF